MTRLFHLNVCAVSQYDAAYHLRNDRGVPLGFSPRLWRHGWEAELADATEQRERCAVLGATLGLLAMRPLGVPLGATTSFRIDASEQLYSQTGRNPGAWIGDLRLAWPGPIVCGLGSQREAPREREFTTTQFRVWTQPVHAHPDIRASYDECAGESAGSPIHACLSLPGVRERAMIERAPRLVDTHWRGFPIFGNHRGARTPDRVPLEQWPAGSIVRIEHRDHVQDGKGGWTGERTDEEVTAVAVECLRANPGIGVALDTTRLSETQLMRLAAAAQGAGGVGR